MDFSNRNSKTALFLFFLTFGVGFNALLSHLNELLELPFFLDSIATAAAGALLGPLAGAVIGLMTNLAMEVPGGFPGIYFPFALCNASTGIIVGLYAKYNRFSSIRHALEALLLVTLTNSLLGSTIATYVYGGITGVGIDYLVTGLMAAGASLFTSAIWARIPANIVDKTIAVFIAYFLYFQINMQKHENREPAHVRSRTSR